MKVEFRGYVIELLGKDENELKRIWESRLVRNWLNSLDNSIAVKCIELQNFIVDESGDFRYIKISTISERNGGIIPRILILDGESIAIMVVVNGKSLLLIERPRIATGSYRKEILNVNTDGKPVSKELACEITKQFYGIDCEPEQFVELIHETLGKSEGIHPYCGPCDRQTFYYLLAIERSEEELQALVDKEVSPNMRIKILNLEDVGRSVNDFVTMSGMLFYKKYLEKAK